MPPKYPFARNHPANVASNDPSSSTTTPRRNQVDDRPIVVSASGIEQKSPGVGLTADSPSTLRSRIPSPRNPLAGFTNNSSSYPSPSTVLQQGKSRLLSLGKKKKNSENGRGWMRVDTESPTKDTTPLTGSRNGGPSSGGISIPRYDARGYPIKETDKGNGQSESGHSIAASSSSHTAGVDGESGRPPQRDRRPLPQAPDTGVNGLYGSYPPAQNGYSYSQPYSPYDPSPSGDYTPSIYAESAFSVASYISEGSMTHFKKYDALKENYSSYSISSKGGPRHLGEMFHLPADPTTWSYAGPEADDDFHDPDIVPGKKSRVWYNLLSVRGASNIGCLALLFIMLVMLFAGYPVITYYTSSRFRTNGGYNLGGINATGQIPNIGPFQLIDRDTPQEAYSFTSMETGETWDLIFSDEFNNDGRTFWDGDDPYWQAVDLHYWATNNLEWYDPRMITTKDGSLRITLTNMVTNNMNYTGGMMSTWNRFCFTGGYVEASVRLPGSSNVYGLWPAIWSMGNLGRAGYGGTLDGMWPYSYDSCDVGTLPNQTMNGLPEIATTSGPQQFDGSLSYLPGQRLSRCTCHSDTTHPGPKLDDGTFVGRAAPEIDMIEAIVNHDTLEGEVSLSGQWAPFNPNYYFINNSKTYEIYDTQNVIINSYQGGVYQQATSGLGVTDQNCYEHGTGCFSKYGFEYQPGRDDGYITWVSNAKKAWTVRSGAMGPNTEAGVGQRLVSEEPMYLIMNLGISENFGAVDYEGLMDLWPVHMDVDYVRVYQDPKKRNIGCDPADHPTAAYIEHFAEAYSNPNITTYEQVPNSVWPKNTLVDQC